MEENRIVLASACLLSIPCQYDGNVAKRLLAPELMDNDRFVFVPVCPEQLAGLPTPRPPVEIRGGDGFDVLDAKASVVGANGVDCTNRFLNGARIVAEFAERIRVDTMVTQKRSPSCSCAGIYDGTFSHALIDGFGVCAAALSRCGIRTVDIDEFERRFLA